MDPSLDDPYRLMRLYMGLRDQLMGHLTDDALGFSPGGGNPPLSDLCRQIGEVQTSYIQSFRTFEQDFSYRHPDSTIGGSVEGLQSWYEELDADLEMALDQLSANDLAARIDRGGGFEVTPAIQLEIYKEALLIFYGKTSVYLKALDIQLGGRWESWIE
ncbi:MAG: hypothetical protein WBR18_03175 [Anaerolineales bacterium]